MHIELFAEPGVGNDCPSGNTQRGEQGELPGGAAVDEGDFRGADHVDDQRLGSRRFYFYTSAIGTACTFSATSLYEVASCYFLYIFGSLYKSSLNPYNTLRIKILSFSSQLK